MGISETKGIPRQMAVNQASAISSAWSRKSEVWRREVSRNKLELLSYRFVQLENYIESSKVNHRPASSRKRSKGRVR